MLVPTSCEELTHWKRLWCWEGLGAGGEGDDRGWDGWMASLTQWMWVWVNSGSWWWTGRPGVLRFMGSQRVGHNWATELNWTDWLKLFSAFIANIDGRRPCQKVISEAKGSVGSMGELPINWADNSSPVMLVTYAMRAPIGADLAQSPLHFSGQ